MQQGLANYREAEWSGWKVEFRARAGFPLEPVGDTKGMRRGKLETTGEATVLSRETLTSRNNKKRQESGSESRAESWGAKVVPVRTREG